jgi:hypothetical protein
MMPNYPLDGIQSPILSNKAAHNKNSIFVLEIRNNGSLSHLTDGQDLSRHVINKNTIGRTPRLFDPDTYINSAK